jgi:hypothetical protein
VDAETADLRRRWQPAVLPSPAVETPAGAGMRVEPRQPAHAPSSAAPPKGQFSRVLPVALGAGAAVIGGVVLLSLFSYGSAPSPSPTVTATPSPVPTVAPTPALLEAPVASPPQAPVARGFEVRQPGAAQVLWFGVVLPLLLLGMLGAAAWLVVRSWRSQRAPRTIAELDSVAIDREIRTENLRFSLVSGTLVVLSGMSLLYVGDPTFGSPGDYLTVALWGTAVGEGLHLARRLWPFPSVG